MTERRADAAERDAEDRFIAAYLASRVGASFSGRISGVTRFGLFVTLDETGADGMVPISTLPSDYYVHEEARHRLVGRDSGRGYVLGDAVEVRLAEADMVTGGLIFGLLEDEGGTRARVGHRSSSRAGKARAARGGRRPRHR